MHPRAEELIRLLDLEPHPEGGYYRRIYRSDSLVLRETDGIARRALTSIYFLLTEGCVSRWHRVLADEAWHHYEGAALKLLGFSADGSGGFSHRLGQLRDGVIEGRMNKATFNLPSPQPPLTSVGFFTLLPPLCKMSNLGH